MLKQEELESRWQISTFFETDKSHSENSQNKNNPRKQKHDQNNDQSVHNHSEGAEDANKSRYDIDNLLQLPNNQPIEPDKALAPMAQPNVENNNHELGMGTQPWKRNTLKAYGGPHASVNWLTN